MKKKVILYITVLLYSFILAFVSPLAVSAPLSTKLDKEKITVGEHVLVEITIPETLQGNLKLQFNEKRLTEIQSSNVHANESVKKIELDEIDKMKLMDYQWVREDSYHSLLKLTMTSYHTGQQTIPSMSVEVGSNRYETVAKSILIESILKDKEREVKDIEGPQTLQIPFSYYLKWFLFAIVLGVLLFLLIKWVLKKVRGRGKTSNVEKKAEDRDNRPIHIIALEKLYKIESKKLPQQGEVKEFYFLTTEVLREYLTKRYGIDLVDKTTLEIVQELKNISCDREIKVLIEELLSFADLVKFAKHRPEDTEIQTFLPFIRQVIDKTKIEIIETLKQK